MDYQPTEAVRTIESTLVGAGPEHAFGALVFDLEPAAEPITAPATVPVGYIPGGRAATQVSMEELISRQHQTERFLAPSIWPTLRQGASAIRQSTDRFVRTNIFRRPARRIVQSTTPAIAPQPAITSTAKNGLRRLTLTVQGFGLRIGYMAGRIIRQRRDRQTHVTPMPSIQTAGRLDRLVLWFQQLTKRQQNTMGLVVVLVLVLSVTIVRSAGPLKSSTVTVDRVGVITDHLNKAEAALLYGGDSTADQEMNTAETLIAALPNRRAADKSKRQELTDRLQTLIERTAKQTVINDPNVFTQFSTDLPNFQPQQIYLVKNSIVSYDTRHHTAAATSLTSPEHSTVIPSTVDLGDAQTGTVTGPNTILFVTDRTEFAELDVTKKTWRPIDASFPRRQPVIQYISFFQNKIYVLDRGNQEIYRFGKGSSSLGSGGLWLKEPAELTKARAALVDGSVYVLMPGGQIQQYNSGRLSTDWKLSPIRPALTEATRLWTDVNSQHLYVLDPSKHRVVVFDKHGQLVDQYTSPAWTNLQDVVADEANHRAFVINGTTIYKVTLKH
jgi:hypothetical protein